MIKKLEKRCNGDIPLCIFTHPVYKILIAIFACVLWGSAFPTLKTSYKELNLMANDTNALIIFASLRFMLASFLIMGFYFVVTKKNIFNGLKASIWYILIIAVFQTTLQYLCFYNGLVKTPGSTASIIGSSGVFFTVILAHFFFDNDKINVIKIIGLFLGFAGIIIANGGASGFFATFNLNGEGLIIASSFVGALGGIFVKIFSQKISPIFITMWQLFFGSSILLIAGLLGNTHSNITITPLAVVLYIYSAFLSATAFTLWNNLLKYNKPGEIGLFKFVIPVSGSILSTLFLKEAFTIYIVIALILVSLGTLLVNKFKITKGSTRS